MQTVQRRTDVPLGSKLPLSLVDPGMSSSRFKKFHQRLLTRGENTVMTSRQFSCFCDEVSLLPILRKPQAKTSITERPRLNLESLDDSAELSVLVNITVQLRFAAQRSSHPVSAFPALPLGFLPAQGPETASLPQLVY